MASWWSAHYSAKVNEVPRGDKFEQALLFAVRSLGQVNVTKLEKLLYLADLEYFHRAGRTLTGARWVRYELGPLARRLVPARNEMVGYELAVADEKQGDWTAHVYRPGPSPRFEPALEPAEQEDLERVIKLARPLNTDQMIKLAYNTTPMRFLLSKEQGHPRFNVPIPFELDLGVVAASTGEQPDADVNERRSFKAAELVRIADLQEAMLARADG